MPRPAQNSKEDALREEIVEVPNGIVVPVDKAEKNGPSQKSGVLDAEGNFVAASSTLRPVGRFNAAPPMPAAEEIAHLPGRYMYGGVMFGHFGHFLMDTLARIWAVDRLRGKIDGVLFTPKVNGKNVEHVLNVQRPLMQGLGMDMDVVQITAPTRVDLLHVPYQGLGLSSGWELGTDAFRDYMKRCGGKSVVAEGPEKIYLSRSGLGPGLASYFAEQLLEEHLRAAGYAIVHPQKHSKVEQIAMYKAARLIVSPDGSPLHLLAYVGNADQRVAVISRRNSLSRVFERQIEAFTGCDAVTINCLKHDWLPQGQGKPGRLSWGELDMGRLFDELMAAGFLPEGTARWPDVTDEEIAAELSRVTTATGKTYRRFGDDAKRASA